MAKNKAQKILEIFGHTVDPDEVVHADVGQDRHLYNLDKDHPSGKYNFSALVYPRHPEGKEMSIAWSKDEKTARDLGPTGKMKTPGSTRDALFAFGTAHGLMKHVMGKHDDIRSISYSAEGGDDKKQHLYDRFADKLVDKLGATSVEKEHDRFGSGYTINLPSKKNENLSQKLLNEMAAISGDVTKDVINKDRTENGLGTIGENIPIAQFDKYLHLLSFSQLSHQMRQSYLAQIKAMIHKESGHRNVLMDTLNKRRQVLGSSLYNELHALIAGR